MTRQIILATLAVLCSRPALAQQAKPPARADRVLPHKLPISTGRHGILSYQNSVSSGLHQPVLAGQYYDYLVQALSDYKSGKRSNPIMKGFAAQLSRQDIEDLAAWFTSQRTPLHNQR